MSSNIETGLVLVQDYTPIQIFAPGSPESILEKIRAEVLAVPRDISTEEGRRQIASLAYKVARTKTFIDQQRLELVSNEKKRLALIDAEGKKLRDGLDDLKAEVRKPLDDWEEAQTARAKRYEDAIAKIEAAPRFDLAPTSVQIDERIQMLKGTSLDGFEEFERRARLAHNASLLILEPMLAGTKAREEEAERKIQAEREEAERKRREREEQIAKEAREAEAKRAQERAEQVERAAEAERQRLINQAAEREAKAKAEKERAEERARKAEAERKAAEERSERDRQEAARKAEAERLKAIEDERARVAEIEEERLAAERKREGDKKHRERIKGEAIAALVACGIPEETAKTVVKLISQRAIPNIQINY